MGYTRDAIPEAVKRRLRREAGFGCCRCGSPFIQYHHIRGVAITGDDPREMMVLCPNCHHLATTRALSRSEQFRLKKWPRNRQLGYASGILFTPDSDLVLAAGSSLFFGEGFKIAVDDEPLLAISRGEHGDLRVSVALYDGRDNLLVLVEENEWITGSPEPWDIDAKPRWLCVRNRLRNLSLVVDARTTPVRASGQFFRKGHTLLGLV